MTKDFKKKFVGNTIKEQRKISKLTQSDISKATGLSRNYICDIEGGRYMPSVDALSKIASVLKLDLNFLSQMSEMQDKNRRLYNAKSEKIC